MAGIETQITCVLTPKMLTPIDGKDLVFKLDPMTEIKGGPLIWKKVDLDFFQE